MHRIVFGLALALAILPLASAPSATPSHPLSHINPIDVDLNMSGQRIYNVSNVAIQDGLNITEDGIAPGGYSDIGYNALEWNNTALRWEVQGANVSLNNNELQEFFAGQCGSGEVVSQVYSNGSYNCQSISESTDDKYVNEAGDTMNGSLNFTDYANYSINNVSNINGFFQNNACQAGYVVDKVNADGSFVCTSISAETGGTEDLNTTLSAGNSAGNNNIDMNGQNLLNAGRVTFNNGLDIGTGTSTNEFIDIAIGQSATASGTYSGALSSYGAIAIGSNANASADGSVAIGDDAIAPNSYEATFGNLNGEQLDVNITGGLTVHGEELDLRNGNISNIGGLQDCTAGQYVNGEGDCQTDNLGEDNQNLSEVLVNGNRANQSLNMDENVLGNVSALQDNSINTVEFDGNNNIAIPNGNLDLSNNNISNYWNNNVCGEDRAVKKIYENGTVTCTQQIEFADNVENLSETLSAGNVANQSINMDGNNVTNPGYVDTVDLDSPGTAISLVNNQYRVTSNSINDVLVTDNSLTNSSFDSFSSFTLQDLYVSNELTGTNIVNSDQINSGAVTNSKINNGAVGNNKIALSSINNTQIQINAVTNSELASNSVTRTGGELDSSVAGEGLSYETGSLNVSTDGTLVVSANDLGIADSGVDTVQIAESAVTNGEIALDAVNRSQIDQSGCTDNEVLEWNGSEWSCANVDDLGTDDQNLQYNEGAIPTSETVNQEIGIEDGDNISFSDAYEPDNQTLSEVLVQGNTANQSINMDDNSLNNVNSVDGGSDAVRVDSNLDTNGNSVTSSGGEMCLGDMCP